MSRRWMVRILAGVLLVVACVRLGMWQLDRNEERSARNEIIEANQEAPPAQLTDVLGPDLAAGELDESDQWRRVEVTGRYDTEHEMLLRLRPLEGRRGYHVITPLVTDDGTALLVDRGFYRSDEDDPDLPDPPSGEVTVVARLRASEDERDAGDAAGGRIRYVNVEQIAEALPYPLAPAWAEAIEPVDDDLLALPAPESDPGPHLSYAFQWFIFAVVGVTGFVLLVRAEARGGEQESADSIPDVVGPDDDGPDDDAGPDGPQVEYADVDDHAGKGAFRSSTGPADSSNPTRASE